jgi:hypothetical protein
VDKIDAILPQTQCGQCGFPGCKPYAQAIAKGEPRSTSARRAARKASASWPTCSAANSSRCPPSTAWKSRSRWPSSTNETLHRLHAVHPGLPGGRHRRRRQADAHHDRRAVHRLRTVRAALPGRLHHHGARCRNGGNLEVALPGVHETCIATLKGGRRMMRHSLFPSRAASSRPTHKDASTTLPIARRAAAARLVGAAAPEHRRHAAPLVTPAARAQGPAHRRAPTATSRRRSMPPPRAPCWRRNAHDAALFGPVGAVRGDRAGRRGALDRAPAFRLTRRDAGRRATTCATRASSASAAPPSPATSSSSRAPPGKLETLVINGAECEPFITCDDLLMRERAEASRGIAILRHMQADSRAGRHRGQQAGGHRRHARRGSTHSRSATTAIEVVPVPTRYPAGGEKQLIRVLTGIEVPTANARHRLRRAVLQRRHRLCHTRAIELGQPLISRIVTVAGNVGRPATTRYCSARRCAT